MNVGKTKAKHLKLHDAGGCPVNAEVAQVVAELLEHFSVARASLGVTKVHYEERRDTVERVAKTQTVYVRASGGHDYFRIRVDHIPVQEVPVIALSTLGAGQFTRP
jgi:hypothetical protein